MRYFLFISFLFSGIVFGQKVDRFSLEDKSVKQDQVCELDNDYQSTYSRKLSTEEYYEKNKVAFDSLLIFLAYNPNAIVEVGCFTDSEKTEEKNLELSQNIANKMVDVLIYLGIESNRLIAKGYGNQKPGVPNEKMEYLNRKEKENAHTFNRRVELKIVQIKSTDL